VANLTRVQRIDTGLEAYLSEVGTVFRTFRQQDSSCVSYGVEVKGRCWFVKHSSNPRGMAALRRARHVGTRVRHPALPRFWNSLRTPGGLALVYDWVPGELLYDYTVARGEGGRNDPLAAHARFRALPPARISAVLHTIYDVHLVLAGHGFVAVDFYDGCILYDFGRGSTFICDLDEYRPSPFILDRERLPGSRRFMAPEEWTRGALIDQVTNVYTLGRAALVLLGDGSRLASAWRGSEAMWAVASRATEMEREARYPSVRAFVQAWRLAVSELGAS
jgi:serine/threonine-protein kinase